MTASQTSSAEFIGSSEMAKWDEVVARFTGLHGDINFSAAYHHMFEMNGDGKMTLFMFSQEEKSYIYPFLEREIPGTGGLRDMETVYGYTGPFSNSTDERFLQNAREEFSSYCRERKIICEFVRFNPLLENEKFVPGSTGMTIIPLRKYVYVECTKPPVERMNSYTSPNRNKIRKAERAGIRIIHDDACVYFDAFVSVYLANMRDLKAPEMYLFSDDFFSSLRKLITGSGKLLIAKLGEEIVGAAVFLRGGRYGYYYLSSLTHDGRKTGAGNKILHEGVRWAADEGLEKLHLGGGLSGDDDDQLLIFKKNFSPLTVTFSIGKCIHLPGEYERLVTDWEKRNAGIAASYRNILQRYRIEAHGKNG